MTRPTQRCRGLFVTGTGTGVGKTTVGAALVRYFRLTDQRVGAYKPVASGCHFNQQGDPIWDDVEAYFEALDGQFPRERICPQRFSAPLAPPVAARSAGLEINDELLAAGTEWWQPEVDWLLVEGAGGLLSPLSDLQSNADLAVTLGYPLLIVARLGLGTINHTLLTVEAAQRRGLEIRGIVLNSPQPSTVDESSKSNPDEIARRCDVAILGVLPYSPDGDLLHHPAFLRMTELLEQR